MCVAPIRIPNGSEIGCRKCWQCRSRKVSDWVGRNIAESLTARVAHSVTLTYGRDDEGNSDHVRAAVLTYSDVQKFFKHLRADKYPVRYFVVGEYGSVKGRAHWHALLYWLQDVPVDIELETRFDQKHWPHGYSFYEEPSVRAIKYVCKYIQKDMGDDARQGFLAMSKKPPLGAEYFKRLAGQYVDQRLAPQEPFYTISGAFEPDGSKTRFRLSGASLGVFLDAYIEQWKAKHGGHYPASELVEEYEDSKVKLVEDIGGDPFYDPYARGKLSYG